MCAELNLPKCDHDETAQCLQETWTSVKIQKAIKHGYEVKQILEI